MKFFGNANLQQNYIQNAVLETLTAFPMSAKVGQIAFVNNTVYICVQSTAPAIWVPLTKEITAYTHTQTDGAAVWDITHSLNTTSVQVQVFDIENRMVIPEDIQITGPNTVSVSFGAGNNTAVGKVTVVTGYFDGVQKPTYAYTWYQTSSSSTWTITHNLGYEPIVRVFMGTNEVQPAGISFPNMNTTIITFATPVAGTARLI